VFFGDGDEACIAVSPNATEPLQALLLAGAPLGEPVARYGPFVMNTHDELAQAVQDYQAGKMGCIVPEPQ
jgi:redox-sensitive bicupin YhaK (pirin superfamily)